MIESDLRIVVSMLDKDTREAITAVSISDIVREGNWKVNEEK